jgi:putative FmdB family regulatory protein
MPIYEYRCSACGHELEVLQKMSDEPRVDCPSCGKATLSKLVSAAGFQLKGSGWYVTDFREGKKAKEAGKAKEDPGTGESVSAKDSGSGDSASEKKDTKTKESKAGESGKPAAGGEA